VFLNPINIYLLAKTFSYASTDGFFGSRDNPMIAEPPRDEEIRKRKGYTMVMHTKIIKRYSRA
jgi:hypothetical protein